MMSIADGVSDLPSSTPSSLVALVCAAGRSSRFSSGDSKIFSDVAGASVLLRSVQAIQAHPLVRATVILCPEPEVRRIEALFLKSASAASAAVLHVIPGGETRQLSVQAGLQFALRVLSLADSELVLVHDAARCLVLGSQVSAVVEEAARSGAATLAVPVTDTIVRAAAPVAGGSAPAIAQTLRREELWAVQTPQVFRAELLLKAHQAASARGETSATDDAGLVRHLAAVSLVMGSTENLKITRSTDLAVACQILKAREGTKEEG